jgi:hypothetical protein
MSVVDWVFPLIVGYGLGVWLGSWAINGLGK